MKTRITELFGIEHPVVMGGMAFVSVPPLVSAVSNAGGLGIIGTGFMSPDELRVAIRKTKEETNKPFGVNLVHIMPMFKERFRVVIEEKVPIVSYALGFPNECVEEVKQQGMITLAIAGALKHAVRAEQQGAHAVAVYGEAGGGHVGRVATIVLVPQVVDHVKIPVVAGGGICDGRGLAAILSLGAEGVYMGTRFALTKESPLPDNIKELLLQATEEDTLVSTHCTGLRCRVLKSTYMEHLEKKRLHLNIAETISNAFCARQRFKQVPLRKLIASGLRARKETGVPLNNFLAGCVRYELAMVKGNADKGWLACGQVCGRINDMPSCQELIERMVREAEETLRATVSRVLVDR